MLVVKVELWPGGDEERVRELSRLYIANVTRELHDLSDYRYRLDERENRLLSIPERQVVGDIWKHYRNQSAWALIRKIIDDVERQEAEGNSPEGDPAVPGVQPG